MKQATTLIALGVLLTGWCALHPGIQASDAILRVPSEYATIADAIADARTGDTVLIAPGTYTGPGNTDLMIEGKAIAVMSEAGADTCIIDAETAGRCMTIQYADDYPGVVVEGLTFRNGQAQDGGALYIERADPRVRFCRFETNAATAHGGAVLVAYAAPVFYGCRFTGNTAGYGGAMGVVGSDVNARGVLSDCVFHENACQHHAGALRLIGSDIIVFNCIFTNNTAGEWSGAVFCSLYAFPDFIQCSFTGNSAPAYGCIASKHFSNPGIVNSIIWGNSHSLAVMYTPNSPYSGYPSDMHISYSDIQGGITGCIVETSCVLDWGDGMLDTDPLHVDGPEGTLYLSHTAAGQTVDSPCIDAGSDLSSNVCISWPGVQHCIDEYTTRTDRIPDDAVADMGAHYTAVALPTATPTWTPSPTTTPSPGCSTMGCTIEMPYDEYNVGTTCYCRVHVCNTDTVPFTDVPVFVILDVYGTLFFAPSFSAFDYYADPIPPGMSTIDVLPEFPWPAGAGEAYGINFYAAMTNPEMTELLGEMDMITFGWNS